MARRNTSHLRNSILFTSLFTIVGIMAIILPLFYSLTSSLMQENATLYTEKLLSQVKNSVEFYTNEMITVAAYLSDNEQVAAYLRGENPLVDDLSGTRPARDRVAADLKAIVNSRADFVNIILIRNDGTFVTNRDYAGLNPYWDYHDFDWYKKTIAARGKPVMSSSRIENIIAGEHRWVVSLSQGIYENGQLQGILLIDLNYKTIADICSTISAGKAGYVFIVGADNQLVYHPQQRLIYSNIKSERLDLAIPRETIQSTIDEGKIYSSVQIMAADWTIVSVFDTSKLVTISPTLVASYIGVGLFFALVGLFISLHASKRLTDPILSLKNSMQQFQQGDFDAKADIQINNEIAELGDQFNTMTDRIKQLVENSLKIEEQKRKSEIQALQAQIRPHFLYNTLESIIWMAGVGEQAKVIEMTSALAKLMRVSVGNANEQVTVQNEVEYVTNYLRIQKLRYQDKLNYRIEIDPDVRLARILRLTLQPLVENAIYHGIKPLRSQGLLIIRIKRDAQSLLVSVADNGVGFAPGSAKKLFQTEQTAGESIGLANVNNRIKLFFGGEAGMEAQSAPEGQILPGFAPEDAIRTVVSLHLPLLFE